ncbi:hypothetical protein LJB85_04290 [Porphyromonadaceae bacterium OttesenSCG-928-L07]|nr:hypothetical protein [Porphyromonadaceae bacterium OttesenSCG-928-L07]MDL2330754.1 hypothetical protein [Odoribacter sp. OttesenSCG-928-A06]
MKKVLVNSLFFCLLAIATIACSKSKTDKPDEPNEELKEWIGTWRSDSVNAKVSVSVIDDLSLNNFVPALSTYNMEVEISPITGVDDSLLVTFASSEFQLLDFPPVTVPVLDSKEINASVSDDTERDLLQEPLDLSSLPLPFPDDIENPAISGVINMLKNATIETVKLSQVMITVGGEMADELLPLTVEMSGVLAITTDNVVLNSMLAVALSTPVKFIVSTTFIKVSE